MALSNCIKNQFGDRERVADVRTLIDYAAMCDRFDTPSLDYSTARVEDRADRRTALDLGEVPPVYAVACRTYRCFGGPEEGGWWYDHTDVVEVRRAWDFRGLLKAVRELREAHPTDQRDRYSVLGDSGDVTIYMTRHAHMIEGLQSTERPTYE